VARHRARAAAPRAAERYSTHSAMVRYGSAMMRTTIASMLATALLCTIGAPAASAQSDPLAVVRQQMDAYNQRDAEAFLATYDDNAMLLDLRTGSATAIGKREFGPLYRDMFANGCVDRFDRECPDLLAEAVATQVLGEYVVMHERITLTRGEPTLDLLLIYEVRDGLIYRLWSGWNEGAPAAGTDLIDAQMAAYNAKDIDGFLASYADDVELRLLTTGETLARGAEFLRNVYGQRFQQAGDLEVETVDRIVVSDLVANRERLTDGRGDSSESIDVYLIVDGRIRLVWFVIPRP